MEAALLGGLPGAGHIGGDYFHHREGYRCLFSIYPESSVAGLGIESNYTTSDLLAPGPEGAVATVRFENAREGIEESEARVFLERALLDKDKPLPENLAKRCQDLLDERREAIRVCRVNMLYAYIFWRGHTLYGLTDARSRIRRLYDLAGEVAAITR
jgi:hypothetical protein